MGELNETQRIREGMANGGRDRQQRGPGRVAENEAAAEAPQEAAPPEAAQFDWDQWNDQHSVKREKTGFGSWLKLPFIVIAFLVWVRFGDWVNRDSQIFDLGYSTWNLVAYGPGLVAFLTLFFLPFAAVLPLMLGATLVPLIIYAIKHNQSVESHQKVFTPGWWRYEMAELLRSIGIKVKTESLADYEKGADVDLSARGGDDATQDKANLLTARQSPGFVLVKELVADMVKRRSEEALFDYRQEGIALKHHIDGVWHNGDALERNDGDIMLAVMKQLANLDPTQRTAKQEGEIGAKFKGVEYDVEIASQGVKTGERVMVRLADVKKKELSTYADLGMREKIRDQWAEQLVAEEGLVVISAQPDAGLTTLTNVSLMETDRLMRDVFSVEDARHREREIENIVVHTYDSSKGESPKSILEKLIRLYPNVYVCREFVNAESAAGLINEALDGKLVITNVAANDATESLLRLLKKGAPHKELTEALVASLHMRLIRLLCDACKVAYEPSSELLKKLGIPQGKVQHLYRTPTEEEVKKPCQKCGGIGYRGRTGLFELLIANDQVREVLLKRPRPEYMRKVAKIANMRSHQEEGVLLVAKGATSIKELQRVMKV